MHSNDHTIYMQYMCMVNFRCFADDQLQANGEPLSKPHKPADQLHKTRIVYNNIVTDYLPSRNIKSGKSFLMYFSMNGVIKVCVYTA